MLQPKWLLFYAPAVLAIGLALWIHFQALDKQLFIELNQLCAKLPEPLWACITICGHTSVAFALLSICLRSKPAWILACFAGAPVAGLVTSMSKAAFPRGRPASELAVDQIHIIGQKLMHNSFPSGHSLTAAAVAAAVIAADWGKPRTPARVAICAVLLIYVVSVALSRVAVGAHWPIDTLVGGTLGWICGMFGARFVRRYPRVIESAHWQTIAAMLTLTSTLFLLNTNTGYPQAQALLFVAVFVGSSSCLWVIASHWPHLRQWPHLLRMQAAKLLG